MFEKISGISIKGRCFTEEKALDFFPDPKRNRLALVYGQNGSGKTTCAKGFRLCANPTIYTEELTAQLRDVDSSSGKLPTPDSGWNNIHVFDEDYVINNLRIEEDGLGSIVLLGRQVDIDKQLKDLTEEKNNNIRKRDLIQQSVNQFSDPSFDESPLYLKQQIFDTLKAPGAWAEIDKTIKEGRRINTRVDDALFEEFRVMSITDSLDVLQHTFRDKKSLFERSSSGEQRYPMAIPTETIVAAIDKKICEILIQSVEKPTLSERDQKIFDILTSITHRKDDIVKTFANPGIDICPFCFQSVSPEYKDELLKTISNIFKKEADFFKNNVREFLIPKISRDFSSFSGLDADLVIEIHKCIAICNSIIDEYNKLLEQKYNDVFTPIAIKSLNLEEKMLQLNEQIKELEIKRQEFMQASQKRAELKDELILLNKKIYRRITEGLFLSYENCCKKQKEAQTCLAKINACIRSIDAIILELQQKKENIFIAIEQINHDLSYVFFSKDRIVLEPHGTSYFLKINGNPVKPKDVSSGERNAIALCYFFTESFRNKTLDNAYTEETLFVIDDPVSSLDIGNRVGINSYLKYKIQSILWGNENSKVLVFSHDIVTMWDLEKAFQEICKNKESLCYFTRELENLSLVDFHSKKRNEYSSLMERTYDYAVSKTGDSQSIGNIMRRMLEAFSTFIYRMGIEELSCSGDICMHFKNKSLFFNSLMYRLVLHGESHTEEAARADADEMLCFCYASEDEKQKMARYIIAMIYCLQKDHILIHLRNAGAEVQRNIESWLEEIPSDEVNIQRENKETVE